MKACKKLGILQFAKFEFLPLVPFLKILEVVRIVQMIFSNIKLDLTSSTDFKFYSKIVFP
jgi:hypothetical protein